MPARERPYGPATSRLGEPDEGAIPDKSPVGVTEDITGTKYPVVPAKVTEGDALIGTGKDPVIKQLLS